MVAVTVITVCAAGCSSDPMTQSIANSNRSNIQRLANLYTAYQINHQWKGPKTQEEFKAFIKGFDATRLRQMGIDPSQTDSLFASDRDGKPFKVRWDVPGGMGVCAAVIFEQEGRGGTKQIGFTGGGVEAVDDTRYQNLLAGKEKPTGADRNSRPIGAPPGAGGR